MDSHTQTLLFTKKVQKKRKKNNFENNCPTRNVAGSINIKKQTKRQADKQTSRQTHKQTKRQAFKTWKVMKTLEKERQVPKKITDKVKSQKRGRF